MNEMNERLYPTEVTEVFRWYGAAVHNAQLLEADLLSLRLVAAGVDGLATTEEELRNLEASLSRKTLGQLMADLKIRGNFSPDLEDDWARALDRRNYLIHRFFWDNAITLDDAVQCEALVSELRETATFFDLCRQTAQKLVAELITSLGVDRAEWDTALRQEFDRLYEREP